MTSQPRADRGDTTRCRIAGTPISVRRARRRRALVRGLVQRVRSKPGRRTDGRRSRTSTVATVVSGLTQPIGMAFIGRNDIFVLEKASGKVQRVIERRACRPRRRWISPSTPPPNGACSVSRFIPASPAIPACICIGRRARRWMPPARRSTRTDLASTPLLGNRVDSFIWNGTALRFERNLIKLRAFQADAGQPLRGNHNGGIIRFEVGRRRSPRSGRPRPRRSSRRLLVHPQ